ncbi:zf-HC2 domain-containing protein [Streptomyces cavourensis]|uniref:Zf-HC2 domain-containing protein n=1 Tax=Streptomyces cavourensis TaxID=67258 RepID=A0AAD0QBQ8_9ACTN|nr:zf-HC2 domain-containing protein [Streptomyces cavourensis]AXI75282.1 zf-HC2 domain-containing protein [Streptomyces cavourensis]
MTTNPGDDPHVRLLLGAYVLDALDPEETCRVARHLRTCDSCARDYVETAEASLLLALLRAEDLGE